MKNIKMGFNKIDLERCQFYKDGRAFLRYAVLEALSLKKENSNDNVKHKIALITSYTGLNFILLSILQASIPNESQRKHVIYNKRLEVKNSTLMISESTKTVETEELIKRLKGCNYNLSAIAPKILDIAQIRNNLIHHFNNKPNEELLNYIVSIFIILKDIVSNEIEFWGENWNDLIKFSDYAETIREKCVKSYEIYSFKPNEHYFKCLECGSNLLMIQKNSDSEVIICETCKSCFNKVYLVGRLTNSVCYRETHEVIGLLSAFINDFADDDLDEIAGAQNNSQIGDIIFDDDIYDFYIKIFGDDYFEA